MKEAHCGHLGNGRSQPWAQTEHGLWITPSLLLSSEEMTPQSHQGKASVEIIPPVTPLTCHLSPLISCQSLPWSHCLDVLSRADRSLFHLRPTQLSFSSNVVIL